jgi:Mg-chelatase subunit ChlI
LAAELALPHRIRRGPFQQEEITMEELQDRIEQLQGASSTGEQRETAPSGEEETTAQKKT